jgi:hypothetical protein
LPDTSTQIQEKNLRTRLKSLKRNNLGKAPQKTSKQSGASQEICGFDPTRTFSCCGGFQKKHQCH